MVYQNSMSRNSIQKTLGERAFQTTLILFLTVLSSLSVGRSVSAQIPFTPEPFYNDAQFGSPIISETPAFATPMFENGNAFDFNAAPFEGSFSTPIPIDQNSIYTTSVPQPVESSNITGADGSNYVILGDVTGSFNFGGGQYDNIPFLNEGNGPKAKELPKLQIPANDEEFVERVDAMLKRFSQPQFPITRSTPARLLRYSLIGGADETFLAPNTDESNGGQNNAQMKPIYALGALCWNLPCSNRRLMRVIDNRPAPEVGFGFQTQRGQFLATLAFAKIDRNYELRIDDSTFTVQDLVEWEKYSCSSYANLSVAAIGLAHYSQNPDETWTNQFGEVWSLKRILEVESQRNVDWNTAASTDKLLAFTYLLARLKQSSNANSPELAPMLQKTEAFLISVKKRVWDIIGDAGLSDSLFFNSETKLTTPYMKLYVNGRLLRWLTIVSSPDELNAPKMKKANAELCALVDQLFNSQDDLSLASETDEESFSIALQTLALYRKQFKTETSKTPDSDSR